MKKHKQKQNEQQPKVSEKKSSPTVQQQQTSQKNTTPKSTPPTSPSKQQTTATNVNTASKAEQNKPGSILSPNLFSALSNVGTELHVFSDEEETSSKTITQALDQEENKPVSKKKKKKKKGFFSDNDPYQAEMSTLNPDKSTQRKMTVKEANAAFRKLETDLLITIDDPDAHEVIKEHSDEISKRFVNLVTTVPRNKTDVADDLVLYLQKFLQDKPHREAEKNPDKRLLAVKYILGVMIAVNGFISGEPFAVASYDFAPVVSSWFHANNQVGDVITGVILASGGGLANAALNTLCTMPIAMAFTPSKTYVEASIYKHIRDEDWKFRWIKNLGAIAASAGFGYFTYHKVNFSIWFVSTMIVLVALNKYGLDKPLKYIVDNYLATDRNSNETIRSRELAGALVEFLSKQQDKLLRLDDAALNGLLDRIESLRTQQLEKNQQQQEEQDPAQLWTKLLLIIEEVANTTYPEDTDDSLPTFNIQKSLNQKMKVASQSGKNHRLKWQVVGAVLSLLGIISLAKNTYELGKQIHPNPVFDTSFLIVSLIPVVLLGIYAGQDTFGNMYDAQADKRNDISKRSIAERAFGKKTYIGTGIAIWLAFTSWATAADMSYEEFEGALRVFTVITGIIGALILNGFGTTGMAREVNDIIAKFKGDEKALDTNEVNEFMGTLIDMLSKLPAKEVNKFFLKIADNDMLAFLRIVPPQYVVPMLAVVKQEVRDAYFQTLAHSMPPSDTVDPIAKFLTEVPSRNILTAFNMVDPQYIRGAIQAKPMLLKDIPAKIAILELNSMSQERVAQLLSVSFPSDEAVTQLLHRFTPDDLGPFLAKVPEDKKIYVENHIGQKNHGVSTVLGWLPSMSSVSSMLSFRAFRSRTGESEPLNPGSAPVYHGV